ncbi:hypothetical protein [Helicobacter apodemus]|uniref:hypothetical protein n=1 Tax=Helicobacter apodemus TaxID=135569 RepID=UPI0013A562F3|nr:hypothetical protein [Helicobacter apodemus]
MYRILSIIITSLVVFLAPLFSLDYISDKLDSHLKAFYFLVALICPPIATIYLFYWLSEQQILDWFVKTAIVVYIIIIIIYELTSLIAIAISGNNPYPDILSTSILFLLPLPLTIHAHINQRNIEKYFHLLYMVFAPILLDLFMIPSKEVSLIILCIPLLFVLKNYYLWYRDYKRKQAIREDKD